MIANQRGPVMLGWSGEWFVIWKIWAGRKSANKVTMLGMQKALATARAETTLQRNSPEYDPQSNSGAERRLRTTDMTRRILIGFEARLRTNIDLELPIVT